MSELKGIFKLGQELMIQSGFAEMLPKTRSEWKNVFQPESHGTPSFHSEFYWEFQLAHKNH